mmetsp:Transcript_74381/g.210472  ORF Transcript_74381/g.210472 Transcript_74381/m.210472 type:complete len:285 (+) Transcript_74381:549-1403(+)
MRKKASRWDQALGSQRKSRLSPAALEPAICAMVRGDGAGDLPVLLLAGRDIRGGCIEDSAPCRPAGGAAGAAGASCAASRLLALAGRLGRMLGLLLAASGVCAADCCPDFAAAAAAPAPGLLPNLKSLHQKTPQRQASTMTTTVTNATRIEELPDALPSVPRTTSCHALMLLEAPAAAARSQLDASTAARLGGDRAARGTGVLGWAAVGEKASLGGGGFLPPGWATSRVTCRTDVTSLSWRPGCERHSAPALAWPASTAARSAKRRSAGHWRPRGSGARSMDAE